MKDTKRRLEMFSFYDHTAIQAHLEKMARQGWMIDSISNFGWRYRKIAPKELHFAVSYYPKASEFDPEPAEDQKTFIDFCAHTGWQLACTSAQMQIFYNDRENPVPIETDPALEVSTIHAAAKKNFLPAYAVLTALGLFQIFLMTGSILNDPIGLLSSTSTLVSASCWIILLVLCMVETTGYFRWHHKAKQAAEHGEFLAVRGHTGLTWLCLGLVILTFIGWILSTVFSENRLTQLVTLLVLLYMALLIALVNGVKRLMKKWKFARNVNRTVTFVSSFLLAFLMMAGVVWLSLQAYSGGFLEPGAETYEYMGQTQILYQDELPLTIEDLADVDFDGYTRERNVSESPLLAEMTVYQRPRLDSDSYDRIPSLSYYIVIVKAGFLYDWCRQTMFDKGDQTNNSRVPEGYKNVYEPQDPAPWGAREAYRLIGPDGSPYNRYLLCYDSRIIEIWFDWEPTPAQMAVTGEKLS